VIGRGKHNDVYLYEVTDQDLLLDAGVPVAYCAGNILMFADRRNVNLGNELACAEDLATAKEYLMHGGWQSGQTEHESDSKLAALTSRIRSQDESLRNLTEKIEQRDELLRDLSETLKTQKRDNELLHEQLEQARAQLAVDELKHNELVDDLQHVSMETHTIEGTLERVMDEKFRLEQELAERITELVELNLQNDDLRKQLIEPARLSPPPLSVGPVEPAAIEPATMDVSPDKAESPSAQDAQDVQDARVLTMASGKKIHVLHEFPTAPRQSPVAHAGHVLLSVSRVMAIVLCAILLLSVASIIATAQVNGISYGTALDSIIKSTGLS
jgi:hypothetical protein